MTLLWFICSYESGRCVALHSSAEAYLSPEQAFELWVCPSPPPRQPSAPPAGGASSGELLAFLLVWKFSASSGSPPPLSSDGGGVTGRRTNTQNGTFSSGCFDTFPLAWPAVLLWADPILTRPFKNQNLPVFISTVLVHNCVETTHTRLFNLDVSSSAGHHQFSFDPLVNSFL